MNIPATASRRTTTLVAIVVLLGPFVASTQTPQPVEVVAATFRVRIWGDSTDFATRVHQYAELRSRLQQQLPPVVPTDDVMQIRRGSRSLARAIRAERPGAVQGEFFTVTTGTELRSALARVMTPRVWEVIMDDNPGAFRHDIDGTYPEGKAKSTTPGVVLAQLPRLPEGIEFRFVGPHLILYDVHANTIVDQLPYAITCDAC